MSMPDYDREAARYDATRGGAPRAEAAARALHGLLPAGVGHVLDVAVGTGSVAAALRRHGREVVAVDLSVGMLRVAACRLPGAVVPGSCTALPFRSASCGAVSMVWLLHLLDGAAVGGAVAEAARVLEPGGLLVATVDKSAAHRRAAGRPAGPGAADARGTVDVLARAHGLATAGEGAFVGHGQSRDGGRDPVFPLVVWRRAPR